MFIFRPVALHAYCDWQLCARALSQPQQAVLAALQIPG
jgi:hypothetical protein